MSWIATADKALTAEQARALTDGIRARVADLLPLIKQAYEGRADQALGYATWHDYCMAELSGIRIPLTDRPAAVAELRQNGMSTRAIGSALGVSAATVTRDLAGVSSETPDRVTGIDGQSYASAQPAKPVAPEMPARQDVADQIVAGIEQNLNGHNGSTPERPKPPAWDPEERRQHEEDVQRRRDIDAAQRHAASIVTDLRSSVVTIVTGCRLGETGLVTADMIRDLLEAIELLKGEL